MAQDDRPWYRRPGWYVSALLHAGVVALTLISIPSSAELTPPETFVPVEMLQVADTTNVADKAKADKPKPDPKPAAKPDPKPKASPTPTPPKPKPEPKPEPKPDPAPPQDIAKADPDPTPPPPPPRDPKPDPKPEPTPEPAPTPTPHAKPKDISEPPKDVAKVDPKPEPKPDPKPADKPKDPEKKPAKDKEPEKKPDEPFDIDAAVAGLEDKEKKDDTSKDSPEEQKPEDDKPQKGKGEQTKQTMAIVDAFKTQISKCWTPPAGAPDADKIVVVIEIKLNRDGSLSGTPTYRDPDKLSDPYYRAAAESARRAIMGCQNYTLPADAYDQWSELTLNFNPAEMLGL